MTVSTKLMTADELLKLPDDGNPVFDGFSAEVRDLFR
jgi:hypothetical protein